MEMKALSAADKKRAETLIVDRIALTKSRLVTEFRNKAEKTKREATVPRTVETLRVQANRLLEQANAKIAQMKDLGWGAATRSPINSPELNTESIGDRYDSRSVSIFGTGVYFQYPVTMAEELNALRTKCEALDAIKFDALTSLYVGDIEEFNKFIAKIDAFTK